MYECAECGASFDPDNEGTWIEGIGDVCGDCQHEAGTECALCEERYGDQDKYWSGLVVANHEFVAMGKLWVPGFYQVCPGFYSPSMIGPGSISEWQLLFAGSAPELPETSGYVCAECGGGQARAAALYYGGRKKEIRWRKRERTPVRDAERRWMRAALAAHPDILEGHECVPGELADFWEEMGMTEWVAVEFRGVRVYGKHGKRGLGDELGWLTMDGSPEGREGGAMFSCCSLPGYLSDWWSHRTYYSGRYQRAAVRHAIAHGYLKNGVMVTDEEMKALPRDWYFKGRWARREWEENRERKLGYALQGANLKPWQSEEGALAEVFGDYADFCGLEWTEESRGEFLRGWNSPFTIHPS